MSHYDVIVVGAGHAGCEAALAANRVGAKVLLLTINLDHIAQMSCNPAVGGIAKGQVVREIDAMGGAQGMVTDAAAIQFRMLNQGKGAAVWSPRSQCDKVCYQKGMKLYLENTPDLDIIQAEAVDFLLESDGKVCGVRTQFGDEFHATALVLTTGTFLRGLLHFGMQNFDGGRAGDPPAGQLSAALQKIGLRLGRLKTGTPPRILAKTIDFSQMDLQPAEEFAENFSFWPAGLRPELITAKRHDMPCYLVYTTTETGDIVRRNLDQAPMYAGKIKGIGTRYCPSFEDKVVRFAHHPKHLLYLEPEGAQTQEYYINGISTSLPPAIQKQMVHSVPGLEKAVISRYAYAIEYDMLPPEQLTRTLALKKHANIFTAGQINGTSGYEEAASQGLVAGMNAGRFAKGLNPVELPRDQSYIGVMIDDLVTKDIVEPYRLFTSRAEYRLHLRQDNADLRLCKFAYENGILPQDKYDWFCRYERLLNECLDYCRATKVKGKTIFDQLKALGGDLHQEVRIDYLPQLANQLLGARVYRQLLINAHYDGYLKREDSSINKLRNLELWTIPANFDYRKLSLGNESLAKLEKVRPTTLAQASRIDGVTPADIALLQIYLVRRREADKNHNNNQTEVGENA